MSKNASTFFLNLIVAGIFSTCLAGFAFGQCGGPGRPPCPTKPKPAAAPKPKPKPKPVRIVKATPTIKTGSSQPARKKPVVDADPAGGGIPATEKNAPAEKAPVVTSKHELSPKAKAQTLRCSNLNDRSDSNGAIKACTDALNLDPNNSEALFLRASAYSQQGQFDSAIPDYTRSIENDPTFVRNSESYAAMGQIFYDKKEDQKAISNYKESIKLLDDFTVILKLAYAYMRLPDYPSAIPVLDSAIEKGLIAYSKSPDLKLKVFDCYKNRGISYFWVKDFDKAISDYNKALEYIPNNGEISKLMPNAEAGKKAYDDKISVLTKKAETEPVASNYLALGQEYFSNNKFDEAIANYTKVIGLDPKSSQAYFKRGSANLAKKNFNAAIEDLSKAIELSPTYDNAYLMRGAAYAEKKEYDKAVADLTHFIDSKPAVPDGYRQRARVYDLMNNKELADKDRKTLSDLGVK